MIARRKSLTASVIAVAGVLAGIAIVIAVGHGRNGANASNDKMGAPASHEATMPSRGDKGLASQVRSILNLPSRSKIAPPAAIGSPTYATPSAGIYQVRSGPFSATGFTVSNMCQGPYNGTWFLVYAGSSAVGEPSSASEGPAVGEAAVRIFEEDLTDADALTTVGTFVLSDAPGPLSITRAEGSTITLVDARGQSHSFDLATDTFG